MSTTGIRPAVGDDALGLERFGFRTARALREDSVEPKQLRVRERGRGRPNRHGCGYAVVENLIVTAKARGQRIGGKLLGCAEDLGLVATAQK